MKLFWSTRSPFARKVMIAAHELAIADKIICEPTLVKADTYNPDYAQINPTGQLPALLLDDGTTVLESLVICQYLDQMFGTQKLFPPQTPQRFEVLRRHALGDGIMDRAVRWLGENFRPPELKSEMVAATCRASIGTTLDALERDAASWSGDRFDGGDIAVAGALAYLDFRFADLGWSEGRPALAARSRAWSGRPSMVATTFRTA